jgi:hypothetical protein
MIVSYKTGKRDKDSKDCERLILIGGGDRNRTDE